MATDQPRSYCRFVIGIEGQCGKEAIKDRCEEHIGVKCTVCNKPATCSCDHEKDNIPCGAPLCTSCTHEYKGEGHSTREKYFKKFDLTNVLENSEEKTT